MTNVCVPAVDVQLIVHCPEIPSPPPGVHPWRIPVELESIQRVAYVVAGDTYAGLRAPADVPAAVGVPIVSVPVATCFDEVANADAVGIPLLPPPEHDESAKPIAMIDAAYLRVSMSSPLSYER